MREPIILHPSGRAPITFAGKLVGESSSRLVAGKERSRWHELRLYRSQGGQWLLDIAYRTQWQGEHDRCEVLQSSQAGDLVAELQAIDPTAEVLGYPPGPQYDDKRARLHLQLRQDWQAAVSELLAHAGPDFVARVD